MKLNQPTVKTLWCVLVAMKPNVICLIEISDRNRIGDSLKQECSEADTTDGVRPFSGF
jgi:hypothetical protein